MDEAVEAALRETVISLNDLQATRLTNGGWLKSSM